MNHSSSPSVWQYRTLWLLTVCCVAPFVILCFYAHPSADDWYMASAGRDRGFWEANWQWYREISGRVASQGLTTLHPILLGSLPYQLWCLGFLAGLAAGFYTLVSVVLAESSRPFRALLMGLAMVLVLWGMRSPAQGIYWVNGANIYTVSAILQLFLAALVARAWLKPDQPASAASFGGVVLLAAGAALSTELGMALQLVVLALLAGLQWWEQRRVHALLVIAILATVAASLVIFLSPGLPLRMKTFDNDIHGRLVPALVLSARLSISCAGAWLTTAPFFLLSLPLLAWWPVRVMSRPQAWVRVALSILLMIGTTWGGCFVGAWSMGMMLPHRATNLLFVLFVVEWGVLLASMAALLRAHDLPRPVLSPAAFALVLLALFASLRAPNNVKQAWRDLLRGDARKFDVECEVRYALIRGSSEQEIAVPALRSRPPTLFFNDLKPAASDWRNAGMAQFFFKKAIRLEP